MDLRKCHNHSIPQTWPCLTSTCFQILKTPLTLSTAMYILKNTDCSVFTVISLNRLGSDLFDQPLNVCICAHACMCICGCMLACVCVCVCVHVIYMHT